MSLDELLGPEPSSPQGGGEQPLIDELLGDAANDRRYEDGSIAKYMAADSAD